MFTKTTEYTVLPAIGKPNRHIFLDPSGHVFHGMRTGDISHRPYIERVRGTQLQSMADRLGLYETMTLRDVGTMTVEYRFGLPRRVKGTRRRITF